MIGNVNSAASKLLEQIQRLNVNTPRKEAVHIDYKDTALGGHTQTTKRIGNTANLQNLEKIQAKSETRTQAIDDLLKNIQKLDTPKPEEVERKRYRDPVGSFLDTYL